MVNFKCLVFGGKTAPFPTVQVFRVVRPFATVRVWVEPDLEPTRQFRPVANTNRKYYEEVFDFIVDDLNLQASIAAPGTSFSGNLGAANGVLIPVHVDDIMIIGTLVLVASIASRMYD